MNQALPLNFRLAEVEQIMRALQGGDSCAVVGIGSVGKSNLLRFLQREDLLEAKLGENWESYLFVYVDSNKLLKQSLWGLLELMLHQLLLALSSRDVDEAVLERVDDLHQRSANPETRYLALRYLERAIGAASDQLNLRVVFMFDEFDELVRNMPTRGFAALRALRDQYKYRLMYLVATRLSLKRLREERQEIEAFEELLSYHTVWLGPYAEVDARYVLETLETRHNLSLDEAIVDEILTASGGHPGLLREFYWVVRNNPDNFMALLADDPNVRDECQRIWLCFTNEEQETIINLAGEANVPPQSASVMEQLRRKGGINGPWVQDGQIFSSLFAQYIRQEHPTVGKYIHLDRRRRIVWVNGREIKGLTPLEYKLLAYLENKWGQVCSRDELIKHLYPEDSSLGGGGVTDNRLDSVVKRLRKQIEPNPKEPKYILTVRGHGFRLDDSAA